MRQVLLHDPGDELMMLERALRISPGFLTQLVLEIPRCTAVSETVYSV